MKGVSKIIKNCVTSFTDNLSISLGPSNNDVMPFGGRDTIFFDESTQVLVTKGVQSKKGIKIWVTSYTDKFFSKTIKKTLLFTLSVVECQRAIKRQFDKFETAFYEPGLSLREEV